MAEEHRYFLDLDPAQQGFDRKRVTEHMRVTTLRGAIGLFKVGDTEELSQTPAVPVYRASGIAIATPKKVQGVLRRKLTQKLCDFRWQRHVHGIAGFRASKKYRIVFVQAHAFERNGVDDGQAAPAHQQDQGPELLWSGVTRGAAVTVIGNGLQDLIKLVACKVVGGSGYGSLRLFEPQ
jgi:hypothetical protein